MKVVSFILVLFLGKSGLAGQIEFVKTDSLPPHEFILEPNADSLGGPRFDPAYRAPQGYKILQFTKDTINAAAKKLPPFDQDIQIELTEDAAGALNNFRVYSQKECQKYEPCVKIKGAEYVPKEFFDKWCETRKIRVTPFIPKEAADVQGKLKRFVVVLESCPKPAAAPAQSNPAE